MRWILLSTCAAVALGCGGEKKADTTQAPAAMTPAPESGAAAMSAAPAGPVVEVKMTGNGSNKAAFDPATLTIQAGSTVRFINATGGPHNIAFWPDSVPAGGADALKKGMPNPMTDLTGPFLTQPNQTYDVSFAGAPPGVYKGYCQPHATLGMKVAITVK